MDLPVSCNYIAKDTFLGPPTVALVTIDDIDPNNLLCIAILF